MYRKGKALGEQGYFDKAINVLEDLKKKNPAGDYSHMLPPMISSLFSSSDDTLVDQEIARLRVIDNERERAHKQKMKGSTKSTRYLSGSTFP